MIGEPVFMQEGHIITPIRDINDFYGQVGSFVMQSIDYPTYYPEFKLNDKNLDAQINYAIKKAKEYFQGDDQKIIIGLIEQGKQHLLDKQNYEAATKFRDVCNHMHEIRER